MKKKVVLINTHLDNIINDSGGLVKRLRELFSILEEYDVIILWRPHPLSKATICSMSCNLLNSYEKLIEDFKLMPAAIYDDTGDLDRAIAVSDFCMGDATSSIVALYEATKKPMMVFNPIRGNQFSYMCLQFHAGAQKDDGVYFSAMYFNGFFKLSLVTGHIEYLGRFKEEELKPNLHCGAYIQEDVCWFLPKFGDHIARINLNTLEQRFLDIPDIIECFDEYKFKDFVVGNHEVWLIPKGLSGILRINLINEKIECFDKWPLHIVFGKECTPFSSAVLTDDKLIICPCDLENFMFLDTRTGHMSISEKKIPSRTYSGIAFDKYNLWLSPLTGDYIFKWNIKHKTGKKISCDAVDLAQSGRKYAGIYYFHGYIWLMPYHLESFLRVNPETDEIIEVRCPADLELKMDRRLVQSFVGRVTSNTELMFTSPYANMLLRVDRQSWEQTLGINLRISDGQYLSFVSSTNECRLAEDRRGYEIDYYYPVRAFLDQVMENNVVEEKRKNLEKSRQDNGMAIWNHIKELLLDGKQPNGGKKMEHAYIVQEAKNTGRVWECTIDSEYYTNSSDLFEKVKENCLQDMPIDYWAQESNWSLRSVFQERFRNQIKFIEKEFRPFLNKEQRICDLASANGEWSLRLAEYVGHVDGFDYSMPMVKTAREEALRQKVFNVEFRQADACSIVFDKQYDNFVMMGLLTYIFSELSAEYIVEQVYKAIKTGGRLIVKDTLNTMEEKNVYLYNCKNGYQAVYRAKEQYYQIFEKIGFKLEKETALDEVKKDHNLSFCSLGAVWLKQD